MICNGNCMFCNGCTKQVNFVFPEDESKKEYAKPSIVTEEKGIIPTEPVLEYKVVKTILGKEKVRRVK